MIFPARVETVNGAKITTDRGIIYAIGNRRFFEGDTVWTDGKYAYGFQGRGGGYIWSGEEGVPLTLVLFKSGWSYPHAAWVKGELKYGVSGDTGGLSNNTGKVYFFSSVLPSEGDSYTDAGGLTAVIKNGGFNINPGQYKSGGGTVTMRGNIEIRHDIYINEADPDSNYDRTTETGGEKIYKSLTTYEWVSRSSSTKGLEASIFNANGELVNICPVLTLEEIKEIGEAGTSLTGVDEKQLSISCTITDSRIDNGKIYFRQIITAQVYGIYTETDLNYSTKHTVYNKTQLTAEVWKGPWGEQLRDVKDEQWHEESWEIYDSVAVTKQRLVSARAVVQSYVEADFDIENGTITNKTITPISKICTGYNGNGIIKYDPGVLIIEYISYRHSVKTRDVDAINWPDNYDEFEESTDSFGWNPETVTTKISSPNYNNIYISDVKTIQYPLQDGLYADGYGKIYQTKGGALLLDTGLENLRAALKVNEEKSEWLLVAYPKLHDMDGFTWLYRFAERKAEKIARCRNNKLHKFKAIKKFLNSTN